MNKFFPILFLIVAFSLNIEKLSKFGSPPSPQINPSASYSPKSNQIFVFGGETFGNSGYSSSLYFFNISGSVWEEQIPSSSLTPEGLILSKSFVQDQNKLIVFFGRTTKGISSEVYSFDLTSLAWSTEKFSGDPITSSIRGGHCIFEYNSTQYFGIYGGITSNGKSEDLYLINIETLKVTQMKNQGESPGKQAHGSLNYYQNNLYYFGFDEFNNSTLFYNYNLNQEIWSKVESDTSNLPERIEHASFIYEDKLYIYLGRSNIKIQNYWQAFNFNTSLWEINENQLESIKEFSYLSINSELYIICGSDENGYKNSIFSYEAGNSNKKIKIQNSSMPKKRGYHSSFEYANSIYVFGGSSEGKYFNDMWKFDLSTKEWIEVKMEGDIPEPRDKMIFESVKGVGILLMGGRSENTVYDDFYHFAPDHLKWTSLPTSDLNKISRFSGCMNYNSLNVFFVGGQDFRRAYSDILKYDYFSNISTEISMKIGLSNDLTEHQCWLHFTESSNYFYVFGGSDFYKTPNNKTYKFELFDIKSQNVSCSLDQIIDMQINLASSISIKDGNYVYIIGGRIWGDKINEYLYVFDLNTDTLHKESYLDNLNLIGHSVIQAGNKLYIFGGLLTKDGYQVSSAGTNDFYELEFESTDKFQLTCLGGEIVNGSCKPCPVGTYTINGTCTNCPTGTYSNKIGAQEQSQCSPCKSGEFNDKEGASYCKVCPKGKYCPTGSAFYIDYRDPMVASEEKTNEYTENSEFVENIVKISSLSLLGLFLFCFGWLIFFEQCRNYCKKFDMFVSSHGQELNVPVFYRKTSLGGLFSIIFVLLAISTFATSLLSFLTDNITQNQSLIPSIAYSGSIKAEYMEISIKLYIFGGTCVTNNKCDAYTIFSYSGFNFKENQTSCMVEENNCIIKIKYTDFETEKTSVLRIRMYQLQPYCSIISINVSVSSSIPNELSKIFIPLYPPSDEESFKGNGANKFKIELIPSVRKNQVFYSESAQWPSRETGYHLQNLYDHEVGSTVDYLSFNRVAGLVVEVDIQTSNSIVVTKRVLKYSTSLFLGTLLGSIFGLSGTVGLLLNFVESAEDMLKNRKLMKGKIERVKQQRRFISTNFNFQSYKNYRLNSFTSDY